MLSLGFGLTTALSLLTIPWVDQFLPISLGVACGCTDGSWDLSPLDAGRLGPSCMSELGAEVTELLCGHCTCYPPKLRWHC